MRRSLFHLVVACLLVCPGRLGAQDSTHAAPSGAPVRVFLDCPGYRCPTDFFHTEFPYADFVVSPQDAELHVLVTDVATGGGGREFTITVLGRRQFDGEADTLRTYTRPDATEDDTRRAIAQRLALGLARYVAKTPAADRFTLKYTAPASEGAAVTQARRDPWHYWAFRAHLNTFLNGEQSYHSSQYFGNFSANRVTAALKVNWSVYGSYNRSEFEIDDSTSFINEQKDYGTDLLIAPTLGAHWAWAAYGEVSRNTYRNQTLQVDVESGLEYDVWPYSEVSRRLLTLRGTVGVKHFKYDEMTLYGETTETRPVSTLNMGLDVTQPWGSINASLEGSTYLHDLAKHRLELNGNLDVRIVRGLSVSVFGNIASVHDQLFLPAGGATPEEILLRQRQLATDYSYFTGIGVNYSFGSVFNNVVNPRFRI